MRSIKSLEAEYFLMDFFYCVDCFARLMKKRSCPYLRPTRGGLQVFVFFFQAGSLQMHPEGHSQVPKIAAGNQSHPGHEHPRR